MATDIDIPLQDFRDKVRASSHSTAIKVATKDHREHKQDSHQTMLAILDDGLYVEGGIGLPKQLVDQARRFLDIDPELPNVFIHAKWWKWRRLRAIFDDHRYITVDSETWTHPKRKPTAT